MANESPRKREALEQNQSNQSMDLILPSTVLSTILSNVDIRSICSAAAASRSLRSSAYNTLTFVHSFHILDCAVDIDLLKRLLVFPESPYLKSLKLDCGRLDDSAIENLAMPSLNELCLHNCDNFSGRLITELGNKCHELRSLYVSSLAECKKQILQFSNLQELLKGCSQLESLSLVLDISRFNNPDFAVVWSTASQNLTSLEIGYIPLIMLTELLTSAADSQLPEHHINPPFFSTLQKLRLSLDYMTDDVVTDISRGLPSLTHIDLQDAPYIEPSSTVDLTNNGLQLINQHKNLKHISLIRSQEFIKTDFKRVNDMGIFLMVENCSELESISLGGFCKVTDAGFREIMHKCPNLKKLMVPHGSQLTDILFHDISLTTCSLTHVTLRWCNLLTNSCIKELSQNKDLTVLDLRDCRNLSDDALKSLSTLSKLRTLYLDGTDITDAGISYLGNGECQINSLSLRGCQKLTNACISSMFSGSCRSTLHSLDLSRVSNLNDEAISLLAQFRVPIVELRMRECPYIGTVSVISLASMQLNDGYCGSKLQLLDLYQCEGITPLAFKWFKKPYFPRLRWLGVTGIGYGMKDLVDALNISRPLLHLSFRGEELGTDYWDSSHDWYNYEQDEFDVLEQWLSEDEDDILSDEEE